MKLPTIFAVAGFLGPWQKSSAFSTSASMLQSFRLLPGPNKGVKPFPSANQFHRGVASIDQKAPGALQVATNIGVDYYPATQDFASPREEIKIEKSSPLAIVVLLGWWGASHRQLSTYGKMYKKRNCDTIQIVADKYAVMTHNKDVLDEATIQAVSQVAERLRSYPHYDDIPVVIHSFSIGGAFVVERMEKLIELAKLGSSLDDNLKDDLLLVHSHMKGQLFDSSPFYPSPESAIEALDKVFVDQKGLVKLAFPWFLKLHAMADSVMHKVFGMPDFRVEFWDHMKTSKMCDKQAFLFSSIDPIACPNRVEEIVSARKERLGEDNVHIKKFEDSNHVQHYFKHAAPYRQFIDSFLNDVV